MNDVCPKCGAPKAGESCPKCGVVFSRYRPGPETAAPDFLAALIARAEQQWDDPAVHALFIEQALAAGRADLAARYYRARADDPVARERLDQLQSRLMQTLLATGTRPPRRPPFRYALAFALILLGFILAGTVLVFSIRH